jgi:hypothetical protein
MKKRSNHRSGKIWVFALPTNLKSLNDTFTENSGTRWDVRVELFRQFKRKYVQQLQGLVFEQKKFITKLT